MPLQNRVTPFGEIVSTTHRGNLTGNRGIIHDPETRTLLHRRWSSKAWITCVCEFKGRRRKVMSGRSWTELFFLDEPTAFAAGHRPCFYCRRADALAFRDAWAKGNRRDQVSAIDIDNVLHAERLEGKSKRFHLLRVPIANLPDGTMVACGEKSYLIRNGQTWVWSFSGYDRASLDSRQPKLLAPPSVVRAFRAGYRPACESSAFNAN